ncbi:MAG: HEAT repeat domain-containing protein [Candidatus Solibacter sp.]
MNYIRTLTPIIGLLVVALQAPAQTPPAAPAPPAPPAARAPLGAAPLPRPAVAPLAPLPPLYLGDLDEQMNSARAMQLSQDARDQVEAARMQLRNLNLDLNVNISDYVRTQVETQAAAALDMARMGRGVYAFAPQAATGFGRAATTMTSPIGTTTLTRMNEDRLYSGGQSALDSRQWEQAVEYFGQVVSRNASRVDGALYWKAYALGKLGKRDEANAAIAELRKSYAGSRWLDDAKALELELRQASGQPVPPEAETNEELKLMAINGLMQSDPERAIPLLEGQLKGSASPKVKRNTLFVLAQSNSPKAQALVEQIARGAGNPDLQLKAISYMDQRRRPNSAQVLSEIYASSNDVAVKRAILQSYSSARDKDRLLQAAKTEKIPELREVALSGLAGSQGTPELWQLYQAETTTEGKLQLLRFMYSNSNSEKLLEVVRNEKDTAVRAQAIRVLSSQKSGTVGADTLVSIYNSESDAKIKSSILDSLMGQRNAKALVDIARAEKDPKTKLRIVERLSNMKQKEAQDYLEELLK